MVGANVEGESLTVSEARNRLGLLRRDRFDVYQAHWREVEDYLIRLMTETPDPAARERYHRDLQSLRETLDVLEVAEAHRRRPIGLKIWAGCVLALVALGAWAYYAWVVLK